MNWVDEINKKHGVKHCYDNHKPLKILGYQIMGGSCIHPPQEVDIYIGLDWGMKVHDTAYPWNNNKVLSVYYPITDMSVPDNPQDFKRMIDWVVTQLHKGKRIHVGCIGGHGRTGMFFAALVKVMTDNVNAIEYVRGNYCPKAVESIAQMTFLEVHFGITPVLPTKPTKYPKQSAQDYSKPFKPHVVSKGNKGTSLVHNPIDSDIWGDSVIRPRTGDWL